MEAGKYMFEVVKELLHTSDSVNCPVNNVRRLILSPRGAIVMFHIPNRDGTMMKSVFFDKERARDCLRSKDYVPTVKAVIDGGLCSNIEDIIYCDGTVYGADFSYKDAFVKTISPTGKYGDFTKTFKRLVTLCSTMWDIEIWGDFLSQCLYENDALHVLSDYKQLSEEVEAETNDDWFENYSLEGESQDSPLARHFEYVESQLAVKSAISSSADNIKKTVFRLVRAKDTLDSISQLSGRTEFVFDKVLSIEGIILDDFMQRPYITCPNIDIIDREKVERSEKVTVEYYEKLSAWCVELLIKELYSLYKKDREDFNKFVESKPNVLHMKVDTRYISKDALKMNKAIGSPVKSTDISYDETDQNSLGMLMELTVEKHWWTSIQVEWMMLKNYPEFLM